MAIAPVSIRCFWPPAFRPAPASRCSISGAGQGPQHFASAARVPGLSLTGLELQPGYAALARRNGAENGMEFEVIEGDLTNMPAALKTRQFDHVIMNPPYFDRGTGSAAPDAAP